MSEFGKGLTYCLGLFLAHVGRTIHDADYSSWFNGAGDHLFELEVPENLPDNVKDRLTLFKGSVINWRLNTANKQDYNWAISEAMSLLLEIDKFYGVTCEEADWK